MNKYFTVFIASFGMLTIFLTPNVNSGDAGELITAAYFMGIAHPSGYPLYLMLSKAFSLIPLGNIAFRIAIGSAIFSAMSLTILYWLVFRVTRRDVFAVFSVLLLLVSRSFLSQSVIVKFYPLNLFLILCIVGIWLEVLLLPQADHSVKKDREVPGDKHLFLTAFISSNRFYR